MPKNIADLKGLDREALSAALTEAIASRKELAALSDEDLNDEKLTELESVIEYINAAEAEVTERDAADEARLARINAARAASVEEEPVADGGDEEPAEEPVEDPEDPIDEIVIPDDASELLKEKETVTASGKVVAKAASKAPAVHIPAEEVPVIKPAAIIAAANVPDFTAGQELADFGDVAEAFTARTRGFSKPSGRAKPVSKSAKGTPVMSADGNVYRISDSATQYGIARIQKADNEFSTGFDDSVSDQLQVMADAAKEARLPGGSLVAAGGWCAPSETIYGPFCSLETIDGILSVPEVSIRRGGINFTKGPDYSTLAATWGFLQTEAQAEAGTEKVCYEIECPPFTDVRLDAIGFCVTNGILTNVGYPELTRRVLEIGAVAHAHKVNAEVISRIATFAGAAINYTEIGGTVTDLLGSIELIAEVTRYKYSLSIGATVEVVLPAWARLVARQDYANRNGNIDLSPTDAEVTAWFTRRGLAVQWVYDWQPLPTTLPAAGQALPATVNALVYPAGSFVKGTADVISLDTIYDSVGLSTNTYTAAFFEEGLLVANTCAGAIQVAIALNTRGATGFPAIGAGSGITFAAA